MLIIGIVGCTTPPEPERVETVVTARQSAAEVRDELVRMGKEDQAVQFDETVNPFDDGHNARIDIAFERNARRLAEIVQEFGWPTERQVGADAAKAAFLIVQHADFDIALQRRALAAMTAAGAKKSDIAYLTDRVLTNEGKPQRFGTQLMEGRDESGRATPHPIADPEGVDARRAAHGIRPLEQYLDEMAAFEKKMAEQVFGSPTEATPSSP